MVIGEVTSYSEKGHDETIEVRKHNMPSDSAMTCSSWQSKLHFELNRDEGKSFVYSDLELIFDVASGSDASRHD